jgi:hypothetical protein
MDIHLHGKTPLFPKLSPQRSSAEGNRISSPTVLEQNLMGTKTTGTNTASRALVTGKYPPASKK